MANEMEPPEPDLPNIRKLLADKRPLWRLVAWGSAAVLALTTLAVTAQTESGSARLQHAFAPQERSTPVVVAVPAPKPEKDAETRAAEVQMRLETQVRALIADRDRLGARLASLERNLDDMTGSIKQPAAQEPPVAAAKPAAPNAPPTAQQTVASASPPPAPTAAKAEPPMIMPLAMPAITASKAAWPDTPPAKAASPAADQVQPAPTRTAALPANEPSAEPPRKPELGVDLGGAPNLDVLNLRWAAVKANFGPLLTGLHPLAAHAPRQGATELRLLVGPLATITAAAQLCARFKAARVTCRPVKFEGEQLAQR